MDTVLYFLTIQLLLLQVAVFPSRNKPTSFHFSVTFSQEGKNIEWICDEKKNGIGYKFQFLLDHNVEILQNDSQSLCNFFFHGNCAN
jgi:hypothetical protein